MKLFREEAIEKQSGKVYGDILLTGPTHYRYFIFLSLIFVLFISIFLWIGKYNRKEVVLGYIDPINGAIKIVAEEPAIISEVLVYEGDHVTEGQPLAIFNRGKSSFSNKVISDEIALSLSRELENLDRLINTITNRSEISISHTEEMIKSNYDAIDNLVREKELVNSAIDLIHRKQERLLQLKKAGFVSDNDIENVVLEHINLRLEKARIERDAINLNRAILASKHSLEIEKRTNEVEVLNTSQRKEEIAKELLNTSIMNSYTIRSPISGIVDNIFENEGRQVFPGAPIITISKPNEELIARLVIPAKSSGFLSNGLKVFLRLDAFPYQRYGVIPGTIVRVSKSPINPNQIEMPISPSESFFIADVKLDNSRSSNTTSPINLKIGMTLQAEIIIERHSLMSYLLSPLRSIYKKNGAS